MAAAATAAAVAPAAAAPVVNANEKRLDRRFDSMSMQYLTALWRVDPEGGIYVGKFDQAANLTIPDAATPAATSASTEASASGPVGGLRVKTLTTPPIASEP